MIDWFTVIAQVVNFLILIFLLKRFLYKPIVDAMNRREEKIASDLESAEKKRKEAEREVETYRGMKLELEEKREEMLSQARKEAEAHRKELKEKVRGEVDRVQARWLDAIEREKEAFLQDLRRRADRQVYSIARRVLADLADTEVERRMVDVFIERIPSLEEGKKKTIEEAMGKGDRKAVVSSVFEIPAGARQRITRALRKHIGDGIDVDFRTSPGMIAGIELKVRGYKIAWSVDDYLESLESDIVEALEQETERKGAGKGAASPEKKRGEAGK